MYHNLFNESPNAGHLACFQVYYIFTRICFLPSRKSKGVCIIWLHEVIHTPRLSLAKVSFKHDSLFLNRWKGF